MATNANDLTADDLVLSLYLQHHKDDAQRTEYAGSNNGTLSNNNEFSMKNLQTDRPLGFQYDGSRAHDQASSATLTLQHSDNITDAFQHQMGDQHTETSISTLEKHADNLNKQDNPFKTRKVPARAHDPGDEIGGPSSSLGAQLKLDDQLYNNLKQ